MILLNGKVIFEKEEKENSYTHNIEVLEEKETSEIMFRHWDKHSHNGATDGIRSLELSGEYPQRFSIKLSNLNDRGNRTKTAFMDLSIKETQLLHKFIGEFLEKNKK